MRHQLTQNAGTYLSAQQPLKGRVRVSGDKSISHRALILGGMAIGTTRIKGLLESDDIMATADALRQLGCSVARQADGVWEITGRGVGGFIAPNAPLDFGNSGTGARLLMGALATSNMQAHLLGDASLSKRPMRRITDPLALMGVAFKSNKDCLPITLTSTGDLCPIDYTPSVASAQVKSAVLLAGLGASGTTSITEPTPTRDHTETMLALFGADIETRITEQGGRHIIVQGEADLRATEIDVAGDPSSAAFLIVAGLICPDSEIWLDNMMLNPHRDGLLRAVQKMGGDIEMTNRRAAGGETVVDLRVRASRLSALRLTADDAPALIDEYPILAIAAACAEGESHFAGLSELRVKESDRLEAIAIGLRAIGVAVEAGADWLKINGGKIDGGACVATQHDHRIAMSFLIAGLVADAPVAVDDTTMIATSFPQFFDTMQSFGVAVK